MYILKLIKLKSYNGIVKATNKQPFVEVETEDDAAALLSTGYFELCKTEAADSSEAEAEAVETAEADSSEKSSPDYEALAEMTKAELTQYAENNGISIDECKTKADILKAISIANGGSDTMIDLEQ